MWGFPVNFPLNQSIDWDILKFFGVQSPADPSLGCRPGGLCLPAAGATPGLCCGQPHSVLGKSQRAILGWGRWGWCIYNPIYINIWIHTYIYIYKPYNPISHLLSGMHQVGFTKDLMGIWHINGIFIGYEYILYIKSTLWYFGVWRRMGYMAILKGTMMIKHWI